MRTPQVNNKKRSESSDKKYSKNEIAECAERCAFRATSQVMKALLGTDPVLNILDSGDLKVTYHREDNPNSWWVWWHAPARNHWYRSMIGKQPDLTIHRNKDIVAAIEVKNWNPTDWEITLYQLADLWLSRFVNVPLSVLCIVLTTCVNYQNRRESHKAFKAMKMHVRLVHNRPLPDLDPGPTTQEMRHILEEYITLELLTKEPTKDCDSGPSK
jgi:hypothetical protein